VSCFLQIIKQEAVRPLERIEGLVSGDLHNGQMVNSCPPHVGHCGMPEIVELESSILALRQAALKAVLIEATDLPFTRNTRGSFR
jgi:hypothetical protein